MKFIYSIMACGLLSISCASKRTATASINTRVEKTVSALEDKWMISLVNKDTSTLAQILAEEFSLSGSYQDLESKKQYLQTSALADRKLQPVVLQDRLFKPYGNTVVSTGKTQYKGTYKGRQFNLPVRYTNVFVKLKDGWKVVAAHLSTIQ